MDINVKKYLDRAESEFILANANFSLSVSDDAKIVLVAGKPLELEKETGKNIYFDQFGELTSKFNISHVPAVVEQEDKHLKVTEVYIGESK